MRRPTEGEWIDLTMVGARRSLVDYVVVRVRTPQQLRMWETRFGFPEPIRLPSGHRRYDERTATMLGDGAQLCLDRWRGDLRRLLGHRNAVRIRAT